MVILSQCLLCLNFIVILPSEVTTKVRHCGSASRRTFKKSRFPSPLNYTTFSHLTIVGLIDYRLLMYITGYRLDSAIKSSQPLA